MATVKAALQAKEEAEQMLRGLPGVNGIGITWDAAGKLCVRVNVDYKISPESRNRIPSLVRGVPVLVEEIGDVRTE